MPYLAIAFIGRWRTINKNTQLKCTPKTTNPHPNPHQSPVFLSSSLLKTANISIKAGMIIQPQYEEHKKAPLNKIAERNVRIFKPISFFFIHHPFLLVQQTPDTIHFPKHHVHIGIKSNPWYNKQAGIDPIKKERAPHDNN